MKRNKPRLGLIFGLFSLLALSLCFFSGCGKATLASGGAYAPVLTNADGSLTAAPDMLLFQADLSYQLAYKSLDAAFTLERDNRQLLWGVSHEIKNTLDKLRPEAWAYNQDYLAARAYYIAHPVPGSMEGVNKALGKLQQIAASAQAVLPKKEQ